MMDKIFGHSWKAIQRAQRGGRLHDVVTGEPTKPQATDDDRLALTIFGVDGLRERECFGVIDRLRNAGLID